MGYRYSEAKWANATKPATNATKSATDLNDPSEGEQVILAAIRKKPELTQKQLHDATEIPLGTIKRILPDCRRRENWKGWETAARDTGR